MGIMPWSSKGLSRLEAEELQQREEQRYQQQQQNLMNQHYAQLGTQNLTTTTTASNTFNTLGSGTVWQGTGSLFGQATRYTPHIDRLEKLEPGWFYVRWRKPDDKEAEAWAVPIIALAVISGRVEYQLAGATIQSQADDINPFEFLGIVNPKETYDAAFWNEKAKVAYWNHRAQQVAQTLLRSAAQGANQA